MKLFAELKRRRLFRVAALYVLGAWMVLQVFDLLFPRLGVPDAVMDLAFIGAFLGFPVALVFGWIYDITPRGIVRTQPIQDGEGYEEQSLRRSDYLILTALVMVIGAIVYRLGIEVTEIAPEVDQEFVVREIRPNSIAVLPFANMSSDPENEYFCDGVSEEILNRLSAIADLHVIARTSSFSFKNSGFDVPKLAALLGVRYLLQGSVRRDGNQLRISTQLLDQSGLQVWNTSFDREMEGIFDIQREISDSVATAIVPRIVTSQPGKRIPDIEAYQHYLKGREMWTRRLPGYHKTAKAQFEQAIEIDPQFAEPYAGLAILTALGLGWREETTSGVERAQGYIDSAMSLEPDLAMAHAAQGLLLTRMIPPQAEPAVASLRNALELDPNMVNARNWLSNALHHQGREEEGNLELQQAVAIDPLTPVANVNLAEDDIDKGNFALAEQRLLRLTLIPQPASMVFSVLGDLYRYTGRLVEDNRLMKQALLAGIRASGQVSYDNLARSYAKLGMWKESESWFEKFEATDPDGLWEQSSRLSMLQCQSRSGELSSLLDGFLNDPAWSLEEISPYHNGWLGLFLALSGYYPEAIHRLDAATHLSSDGEQGPRDGFFRDPFLALAWANLETGDESRARTIIQAIEGFYAGRQAQGKLHRSIDLAGFALSAQLAGNSELALQRMQSAVEAGWRDYYCFMQDPRWASVRDEPGFSELMAVVKEDVDRQRARQQAIDASEDFEAQLASAIVDFESRSSVTSGD
jgi:TolB-like protein/tetratricopeptide (TPR) repeat protein